MAIDIDRFTKHLRGHAVGGFGAGKCARWVRQALQEAGADIQPPYPALARNWGERLCLLGYREIPVKDPDAFPFQSGDIVVLQPYKGGNPAGHIAGFDGKDWISDFIQRDFWCGPGYRKERPPYAVYRLQ
ncbi:hypothetical protein [Pseudoduganella sp.]|uniref:hypothetical protein n=1 Tax=Pseudoduganella sp. TaxID=1880898 RepID=UPI0035B0DB7C